MYLQLERRDRKKLKPYIICQADCSYLLARVILLPPLALTSLHVNSLEVPLCQLLIVIHIVFFVQRLIGMLLSFKELFRRDGNSL